MSDFDPQYVADSLEMSVDKYAQMVPDMYRSARVTVPQVGQWVHRLIEAAVDVANPSLGPVMNKGFVGPSLLLLGPTGTGKTHEAWGAIRALCESGVRVTRWRYTTAVELYARMRPRFQVDPEEVFEQHAHAPVLVLDDIGAAKGSEWTEEVNYRLVDHRYRNRLPTLVTSNIPAGAFSEQLGQRVTSRLREMAFKVELKGADRRKAAEWDTPLRLDDPVRPPAVPVDATEGVRRLSALIPAGALAMGLPRKREPADPNQRAEHMDRIRAELAAARLVDLPSDDEQEAS